MRGACPCPLAQLQSVSQVWQTPSLGSQQQQRQDQHSPNQGEEAGGSAVTNAVQHLHLWVICYKFLLLRIGMGLRAVSDFTNDSHPQFQALAFLMVDRFRDVVVALSFLEFLAQGERCKALELLR